jgi:hypothetical protein
VSADPTHGAYIINGAKSHKVEGADWIKQNPTTLQPQASDLAVIFFEDFSEPYPGKFPSAITKQLLDGKSETMAERVSALRISNRSSSICGGRSTANTRHDPTRYGGEIEQVLQNDAFEPLGGLFGEKND